MYKRFPYLLATISSSFLFLWRNERNFQLEWQESIYRESQLSLATIIVATPWQPSRGTMRPATTLNNIVFNNNSLSFLLNNSNPTPHLDNRSLVLERKASSQYSSEAVDGRRLVALHGNDAKTFATPVRNTAARFRRKMDNPFVQSQSRLNGGQAALAATTFPNNGHNYRPSWLQGQNCSCTENYETLICCQRAILVVHKMGVTAIQSLRDEFFSKSTRRYVPTPEITNHSFGTNYRRMYMTPMSDDYRHVVVTRNWYDALISGYLYHKSGRECWLDWFGSPGHNGWLFHNKQEDWERRLLDHEMTKRLNLTWTPGQGRDLCLYLAEEPEEMGLLVYTAWAMANYLIPLLDFRQRRQELEQRNGWDRTKYICYEQLFHPKLLKQEFHNMAHWLFPNDANVTFDNMSNRTNANRTADDHRRIGHATSQEPILRKRMRERIQGMDAHLFRGAIQAGNAQFGCKANVGTANESSLLLSNRVDGFAAQYS